MQRKATKGGRQAEAEITQGKNKPKQRACRARDKMQHSPRGRAELHEDAG